MELPDALSRVIEMIEVSPRTSDKWYKKLLRKAKSEELDRYKVENDKLYYRTNFGTHADQRLWTLCVPKEQREQTLKEQHDEYSHMGVWKVIRRMKNMYYWPGMHESVYRYIRDCEHCKRVKPSNENKTTPIGQYRNPERAGNMLSIDIMGPWPRSKYGNQYIFVVIDCFTRYIWIKTMRDCTTTAVTKFLEKTVFTANGCPQTIISDNGVQFTSKHFQEMCSKRKIVHHTTPRNHPKANPVESSNKTIKVAVRSYLANETSQTNWENEIDKIIFNINSTPHTSTGKSPNFLHLGRELVRHSNEYENIVDVNPNEDSHDEDKKAIITEEASSKMTQSYENRRTKYNRKAKQRQFKENTLVYVPNMKLSNKAQQYNRKLAPTKIQGYVKRRIGNDTYEIVGLDGKLIGKIHADDICMHAVTTNQIE